MENPTDEFYMRRDEFIALVGEDEVINLRKIGESER